MGNVIARKMHRELQMQVSSVLDKCSYRGMNWRSIHVVKLMIFCGFTYSYLSIPLEIMFNRPQDQRLQFLVRPSEFYRSYS